MGAKEENDPKVSEAKRNEIFIAALGRSYLKEDTEGVSLSLIAVSRHGRSYRS